MKKIIKKKFSRRSFFGAAAALAAPFIIPSRVFGQTAPSDRIRIAAIGIGSQGGGLLGGFLASDACEVTAICDVSKVARDKAVARVEGKYGKKCPVYVDIQEMFDKEKLDAVVTALPDHWHALSTIMACKTGLDVYCEKPLARYIDEGKAMVAAVNRYQRVFQTGSMQRAMTQTFVKQCELVRNGYIGQIKEVYAGVAHKMPDICRLPEQDIPEGFDYERWLGPAPWAPYHHNRVNGSYSQRVGWRAWTDYSIGMFGDWGAHHFDIAQWGLGMDGTGPVKVLIPADSPYGDYTFKYANGIPLIRKNGPKEGSVQFIGTEGWVGASREGFYCSDNLKNVQLKPTDIRLGRRVSHRDDFLNCIKSRQKPICDVEVGHHSANVCHIAYIAAILNRSLTWDPAAERFVGDEQANRFLRGSYREPYIL
ncbi:MAG: Gfo/Idh/MocA family oxidoreductase [Spirochaetes bacterium]|nr:Gfo/Idh/MocA family oxidoreductase [Spirochaetota bacterium]